MAGTTGAEKRYDAFHAERLAGGPQAAAAPAAGAPRARAAGPPTNVADERVELLRELRRLESTQGPGVRSRRRSRASGGTPRTPGDVTRQNWVPIGPTAVLRGQASTLPVVSGRVQDLAISTDGRRVYAATANGGVWRSVDGGDNWEPMSDEFDIDPVARQVDSLCCGAIALVQGADAAHDRLYVGTGEGHSFVGGTSGTGVDFEGIDRFGVGMLRSDDGGATWVQEAAAPGLVGASVYALAVDPTDPEHTVAAQTRGVYRRTAAVPTWTREPLPAPVVVPPPGQTPAVIDNISGVTVGRNGGQVEFYVVRRGSLGLEAEVFRSTAPGAWVLLGGFPNGADRCSIAAANVDPPVLYVLSATGGSDFHGLHRYNLGRAAPIPWEATAGAPDKVFGEPGHSQGSYDQALVVDPNDPDICYVGGSGQDIAGEFSANIFRVEIDAGPGGPNPCTFTLIGGGAHADVHALVFEAGFVDGVVGGLGRRRVEDDRGQGPQARPGLPLPQHRAVDVDADGSRPPSDRGHVRVLRRPGQRRPALPGRRGLGSPPVRRRRGDGHRLEHRRPVAQHLHREPRPAGQDGRGPLQGRRGRPRRRRRSCSTPRSSAPRPAPTRPMPQWSGSAPTARGSRRTSATAGSSYRRARSRRRRLPRR